MQRNWQQLKTDPALVERFLLREKIIDAVRLFFKQQAFHEVETPLLLGSPGTEPYFDCFVTQLLIPTLLEKRAYLATSPEYGMKKLLAAGLGNIFQICKAFRNQESLGGWHNPEFTILEFYRVDADYLNIMDDFTKLLNFVCQNLNIKQKKINYQGKIYDLSGPYPRLSVTELFAKHLQLTADELFQLDALKLKAVELGYDLAGLANLPEEVAWGELYNQLFLNEIEPHLKTFTQPVIVYDYPTRQTALAQKKKTDSRFAERFEVYLAGMELGNAFGELIDAREQVKRLQDDLRLRQQLGKEISPIDQDFLRALELGLPKCSGMAVGIDRLIMLFADVDNIDEVLFFPASELFLD